MRIIEVEGGEEGRRPQSALWRLNFHPRQPELRGPVDLGLLPPSLASTDKGSKGAVETKCSRGAPGAGNEDVISCSRPAA